MTFFGPGPNRPNVDEDFLVAELFTTTVGDDHYPGDAVPSDHWPNVGPGTRGVLNSMSGKYYDTSAFGGVSEGPPITWLRGSADQVISERSMFDFGTLGELGAVPGWPGADVMPPQPMETQFRAVLDRYAGNGGRVRDYSDLRGLRLATPGQGTAMWGELARALERGGLGFADVELETLPQPDALQALGNGAIDGALMIEPLVSAAVARGIAVRWKSTEEFAPGSEGGLVAYAPHFVQGQPTTKLAQNLVGLGATLMGADSQSRGLLSRLLEK